MTGEGVAFADEASLVVSPILPVTVCVPLVSTFPAKVIPGDSGVLLPIVGNAGKSNDA